jgi:phosphatidate cytidylyltransferase
MSTHSTRIKTGLLLAILAIVSTFYFPNFLFGILCFLIISAAFWEWLALVQICSLFYQLFLLIIFWLSLAWFYQYLMFTLKLALVWWVIALVLIFIPKEHLTILKNKMVALIIGFIVLAPTWVAVVVLHEQNRLVLFYLIMAVSFADTAAYFVGSRYGKRRLMPSISPKKSLEGLAGGSVVGTIAGWLEVVFMPNLSWRMFGVWTCLGLVVIMISVLGDLFESLLKRLHDAKDSGSFLPGHGGFLDRIDSQTSAAPILLLICLLWQLL